MTVQVFPQLQGQGFWTAKTPAWNTTTKKAASGRQIRGTQQLQPIWQFKAGYEYIRARPSQDELGSLLAFFNNCQGALQPFYLLDPYDNTVTNQQVATGDGSTTTFQLTRTVGASSPYPFVEPVYGVLPSAVVEVSGAAAAVTLGSLGTIVFGTAPANGAVITWTGQFYFLCHFTSDTLPLAQMVKGLWSADGLTFESMIP